MTKRTALSGGLAAAGCLLAIAICPKNSYAQYGALVSQAQEDPAFNPVSTIGFGGEGTSTASVTGPGSSANAFLGIGAGGVNVQSSYEAPYGYSDLAEVFQDVTTNALSGTMTLSSSVPSYSFAPLGGDYEFGVQIDLSAYDVATSQAVGGATETLYYGFGGPVYDASSNETNLGVTTFTSTWPGALSTEFAVAPDSTYEVEMDASVFTFAVSPPGLTTSTVTLDPTWALNTSPGVTYTSPFSIPQAPIAPEPSSGALLFPVAGLALTAIGCVRTRRRLPVAAR